MTRDHFDGTETMGQAEFEMVLGESWRELQQLNSKLASLTILPEMIEVDSRAARGEGISAMMPAVF